MDIGSPFEANSISELVSKLSVGIFGYLDI